MIYIVYEEKKRGRDHRLMSAPLDSFYAVQSVIQRRARCY